MGRGKSPASGDRVVVDWSGYTIGCVRCARSDPPGAHARVMAVRYFGRPFESKALRDLDGIDASFLRFRLGQGSVSNVPRAQVVVHRPNCSWCAAAHSRDSSG